MDHISVRKKERARIAAKKASKPVANIIKQTDNIPAKENILLDTNVIYWMTYASSRVMPSSLKAQAYQLSSYPLIIESLLGKNDLYYSRFSIPELFHLVSKIEASIDGVNNNREHKEWMRLKGRDIVLNEMKSVLCAIENFAKLLDGDEKSLVSPIKYLELYGAVFMDGYDIFIKNEMDTKNISFIITDDMDFGSVKGINVITANQSV
ncbi:hypothetical protein [Pseudocolwellia agarivorans]|uniref:hypothetical protein n=1 Tax=Pseudocolwellia agarivorans TaxID=1911682 RepID=UPI003F881740